MKDIDAMLQKPFYIIDIVPGQVPENSPGQYFAVEEFFLKEPQYNSLREKFFNVILKLNCYYDISVSTDYGENWVINPSPDELRHIFLQKDPVLPVYVLEESEEVLLTLNTGDTYMTVYDADYHKGLIGMIFAFAVSQGLHVWQTKDNIREMENMVERAKALAKEMFQGKTDKSGVDYFEGHLSSVAMLVESYEEKTVAYLHDILEDTDYPEDELRKEFGDRITDAVYLLTHRGELDEKGYLEYIKRLKASGNGLAIKVKVADLTNNSDYTRLGANTPDDLNEEDRKRYDKYQKALRILDPYGYMISIWTHDVR